MTEKDTELYLGLKKAIEAELERRADDYCDKNPCTRLSDDETHVYTISGEDQLEEAQEDALYTFTRELEDNFPKLADAVWNIMQEMRLC